MIYAVLVGGVVLVPFMVIGGWARRRSLDFGPFFLYAGLLFAFSALVSAVHVPGGTFIHSAVALAPHSYLSSPRGHRCGRRLGRSTAAEWTHGSATRAFTGAVVVFAAGAADRRIGVRPRRLGRQPRQVSNRSHRPSMLRMHPRTDRGDVDRRGRDEVLDGTRRRRPRE
jgi:hypothetical protein